MKFRQITKIAVCAMLTATAAHAQQWQPVGPDDKNIPNAGNTPYSTVVTDENGTVYTAFRDGNNGNRVSVRKYLNGQWTNVGTAGFSAGAATYVTISVAAGGTPYVAYSDSGNSYKAVVMSYTGGSWAMVGSGPVSVSIANYTSIAVNNTGTPYIVYEDANATNKATVMTYNGSSWNAVGTAGVSSAAATYTNIAVDGNNNPYIVYADGNSGSKATVMEYTGGAWATLGTAGFTSSSVTSTQIAIDGNNVPYTAFNCGYSVVAEKFSGGSWATLGTSPGSTYNNVALAIDPNNIPYVAFANSSYKATVEKYSGSAWSIVGTAGFSSFNPYYLSLTVTPAGIPYIGFQDGNSSGHTYIETYNGSSWQNVGSASSLPASNGTAMTKDASGTPYVLCTDASNNFSVKKYVNGSWSLVGSAGFASGSYSSIAVDGSGNVYVAFYTTGASNVWKYNGTSWASSFNGGYGIPLTIAANGSYVYFVYGIVSGGDYLTAYKYNGTSWTAIAGNGSSTEADAVSATVDASGNLYTAYVNQSNSSILGVSKYNGSSWSAIGAGLATSVNQVNIAVDNSGNPYIVYNSGTNSNKLSVQKYNGSSWSAVGPSTGFTANAYNYPAIAFDGSSNPYVTASDYPNGSQATMFTYNGTSWMNYGAPHFTIGSATYNNLIYSNGSILYASAQSGNVYVKKIVTGANTWTGATNTDWNTTTNWSAAVVPTSVTNAVIPGGLTNYPAITSGTVNAASLDMSSGTISLTSGATLAVGGDIINTGTLSGAGQLMLNGTALQSISGSGTISNLALNNSAGAVIASGDQLSITGTYTPTAGTLTTNGGLSLISNSTATANVGTGTTGNYITGAVSVQRYIPGGRRVVRFMGHPFNASLPLTQLNTAVDITGAGGVINGFAPTVTNNPSAYWYDPAMGNGSTTQDPGWTAFTSAYGSGNNAWKQYEGIYLLMRGQKGEGLNGQAYTPSANTITMNGSLNEGDQTIPLTYSATSPYNVIANPFPADINIDNSTRTSIGNNIWVWDATQALHGAYISYAFGMSYKMPAYSAMIVTTTAATGSQMIIHEADKTTGAAGLFKTTAADNTVELRINSDSTFWDRLILNFNDNSMAMTDDKDAAKLMNADVNFYTFSADSNRQSIDVRPYTNNTVIKLGFTADIPQAYTMNVAKYNLATGATLYLHDKYLDAYQPLQQGMTYGFTVTNDAASQGDNRFELRMADNNTGISNIAANNIKVMISPNPASNNVNVSFEAAQVQNTTIQVTNMIGQVMATMPLGVVKNGTTAISTSNYANGLYIVKVTCGNMVTTQRVVVNHS